MEKSFQNGTNSTDTIFLLASQRKKAIFDTRIRKFMMMIAQEPEGIIKPDNFNSGSQTHIS